MSKGEIIMTNEQFVGFLNKHSNYHIVKNNLQYHINNCDNDNKRKKMVSFQNYIVASENITPIFSLNAIGCISVSKPSLPFNQEEMMHVLGFKRSVQFKTLQDVAEFLIHFKSIIFTSTNSAAFIVVGTTLYCNMEGYFIFADPFMCTAEEIDNMQKLVLEFEEKYIYKEY